MASIDQDQADQPPEAEPHYHVVVEAAYERDPVYPRIRYLARALVDAENEVTLERQHEPHRKAWWERCTGPCLGPEVTRRRSQ